MPLDRLVSLPRAQRLSAAPTRCARRANSRSAAASSISFPRAPRAPRAARFLRRDDRGHAHLRSADPAHHRRTSRSVVLRPMSEVLLDEDAIRRFRTRYREQFGTVADDDPLYEAVSAGRRYIGMEHWLPLYYESLETLFDYLPEAAVTLDHEAEEVRRDRLEQIDDFYAARRDVSRAARGAAPPYRAGRAEAALPRRRGVEAALASIAAVGALHAVRAAEGTAAFGRCGGEARPRFRRGAGEPEPQPVRRRARSHPRRARPRPPHPRRRLQRRARPSASRPLLRDHGVSNPTVIAEWSEFADIPARPEPRSPCLRSSMATASTTRRSSPSRTFSATGSRGRRGAAPTTRISSPRSRRLTQGDLVVHAEHGIGRYDGLVTLDVAGAPHDCLRVIYAGDDKLFVPVENIEVLSRYGSEALDVPLDRLGGARLAIAQGAGQEAHQGHRRRADRRSRPQRQLRQGEPMPPPEGLYEEFAARFPYPETDDQDRAIVDTLGDLALGPADGPADLRRCRLRQDRGGAARRLHRGDGRDAGRGRRADDAARAPALSHLHRALRRAAGAHRAALAAGRARKHAAEIKTRARRRPHRHRRRHACAARQDHQLPPSGPARRRRGAAFRRRAEGAAEAVEGQRPCADAHRDADPAHLAAGARRACAR